MSSYLQADLHDTCPGREPIHPTVPAENALPHRQQSDNILVTEPGV